MFKRQTKKKQQPQFSRPESERTLEMIQGEHIEDARITLALMYGARSIGIRRSEPFPGIPSPPEVFGTLMLVLDDNDDVINFYDLCEQRSPL